ncbi:hypothetical protein [Parachlamydia sp. AcF125]|uniref:protein-tyrosine phosphatase family protein n=1 Tax=Parachlamydia sp. AcF125 TaxID=2795736 RepID=UPI001BC8DFA5|nr:hypothetical protein [Parachlamydia sp. AcF125]MBS4167649.1 hypothetical protein [Parachlamydia sp. AcF125]
MLDITTKPQYFKEDLFVRSPCKIYLGENPFRKLIPHTEPTKKQMLDYLKRKYTYVVCLLETPTIYQMYNQHGIKAEHFPIPRLEVPDEDPLRELIDRIYQMALLNPQAKILIHSEEGKERAVTVAACVYKTFAKCNRENVISEINRIFPGLRRVKRQQEFIKNYQPIKADENTAKEDIEDFDLKRGYERD